MTHPLSLKASQYIEVFDVFMQSHTTALDNVIAQLISCLRDGGTIYWAGNGGSASQAQHLSAELLCRYQCDRQALSSICLNSDTSAMTAIANDLGYSQLFTRQVEAFCTSSDVVILLTTSGTSPNIVECLKACQRMNVPTVAFLGKEGGSSLQYASHPLLVPSDRTDLIQEIHLSLGHYICSTIEQAFL